MKFFLKIDQEQEPSVTVVCNKVTPAVTKIEALCQELCSVLELQQFMRRSLCLKGHHSLMVKVGTKHAIGRNK